MTCIINKSFGICIIASIMNISCLNKHIRALIFNKNSNHLQLLKKPFNLLPEDSSYIENEIK